MNKRAKQYVRKSKSVKPVCARCGKPVDDNAKLLLCHGCALELYILSPHKLNQGGIEE